MMTPTVFDKTDKGRDEIATRATRLATRLRTLLLLVDGRRNTTELMASVGGLGLDEKALVELLEGGFIQVSGIGALQVATALPQSPLDITPQDTEAAQDMTTATLAPSREADAAVLPSADPEAPALHPELAEAAALGILREGETQFQAIYNFFNETIRSAIGLRGYALQLRVERAATVTELRALRQSYLDAVHKAKGPELEHSLRNRLDQLLALGD
jgi:hypothetical protein